LEAGNLSLPAFDKSTGSYPMSRCGLAMIIEGVSFKDITRKQDIIFLQKPHK
jgi:hypothetical protein